MRRLVACLEVVVVAGDALADREDASGLEEAPEAAFVRRLVTPSLFVFASAVAVGILSIVTSAVIARLLGLYDFGVYATVLSIHGLAAFVARFGIPTATTRHLSEMKEKPDDARGRLVRASIILSLLLSIAIAVPYFLLSDAIAVSIYGQPFLAPLIAISAVAILSVWALELIRAVLQGREAIRMWSLLNVVSAAAGLPVAVVAILLWGLTGAVLSIALIGVVGGLMAAGALRTGPRRERIRWRSTVDHGLFRKLLGFGVPTMLSGIVSVPAVWIATTLLVVAHGFNDVGSYRTGQTLANFLVWLPNAVAIPLLPVASELYAHRRGMALEYTMRVVRLIGLILLPLTIALAMFSRLALDVVYGPEYEGGYMVLFILTLGMLFSGLTIPFENLLFASDRVWQVLAFNAAFTAVLLGAGFVLVPPFSAWGLGLSLTLAYAADFLLTVVYAWHRFRLPVRQLLSLCLFLMVAFAVGALILTRLDGWVGAVASLVLVGVTTLAVVAQTSSEDRQLIVSLITRLVRRGGDLSS